MKYQSRFLASLLASVTVAIAIMGWALFSEFPKTADGNLHFFFFDIGQGDSAFIRFPSGKTMLIDGGPDEKVLTQLGEVMPFFNRHIDAIVLTHPDSDHLFGLLPVLKRFSVGLIFVSPFVMGKSNLNDQFLAMAKEKSIPIISATDSSDFVIDGVKIDLFSIADTIIPQKTKISDNDTSICIKISYKTTNFLLTGDAEMLAESLFLKSGRNLSSEVLKLGHHGSKSSSSTLFLDEVAPKTAILSVGKENRFGHPHRETLDRLATRKITPLSTATSGTIEAVSNGTTIHFSFSR